MNIMTVRGRGILNSACDSHVLYLHTKGNSYLNARQEIADWSNMMLHFLVETHDDCVRALDGAHDTVGCNYSARVVEVRDT
jgi:hypothetical protein